MAENSGGHSRTVGQKQPNARCLPDMTGNVAEWVHDVYANGADDRLIDPTGPDEGDMRVVRGGSRNNEAVFARSAYRNEPLEPDTRDCWVGFRVARTIIC
ncbi:MAG: SUMF1/EgtB/PvdO family nonheme iron enzyme [Candidatus Sericytochromatia bacterium]|nr:SUMF1/EgtB/PvdO family nonheme iron enzyme [Candidatus Sericytochromatia bacterium]